MDYLNGMEASAIDHVEYYLEWRYLRLNDGHCFAPALPIDGSGAVHRTTEFGVSK